ncbi:protein FAR-RED IMPAIRED RESPONSE 1-like [Neltuma alba]|uniref:protein FAR-RED IMPAIRED RESPONSE 1-like n=1 Tax=Neltuma alba TaxID=207710 RepID=UPI0010A3D5FE|nr:protein FAR-RED IMPAIRED RESPONSE 1-like [Prosopis alba]
MLIDYACFGEVISLDTTYCTNSNHRPLAIFSGFNHYKAGVIFGVALLYDETIETFKWLFETFLCAHKNLKPLTVFTDQDAAMARALQEVMPDVKHALCTWHISRNAMKHLPNSMVSDFNKCMYHCWDEIEFEEAWQILLSKESMTENSWLMSMYQIKEKWAACYMKNIKTLGMRSTQISESVNASVKKCTNVLLDINRFLHQFEQVLEEKRYNELKSDFEARDKVPRLILQSSCMLHQLSDVYTRPIFDLFQHQYDQREATCIKERKERKKNEDEEDSVIVFDYVITMYDKKREFNLTFDPSTETISCSCKKFERVGILCCHALRVLNERDVKLLPQKYIIKRWTREPRCGAVYDIKGNQIEVDPKMQRSNRYRQLCPLLVKLASDASESPEAFSLVHEAVLELSKKVTELHIKYLSDGNNSSKDHVENHDGDNDCRKVVGFKKRYGKKTSKRIKSCVETRPKKRRTSKKPLQASHLVKTSQGQDSQLQKSSSSTQVQHDHMMLDNSQPSQMTFTDLLTASLDCDMTSFEALDFSQTYNDGSMIDLDPPA